MEVALQETYETPETLEQETIDEDFEDFENSCLICLDPFHDVSVNRDDDGDGVTLKKIVTYCGHSFHKSCLDESRKFTKEKAKCPYCRQFTGKQNFLAHKYRKLLNIGDEVSVYCKKNKCERKGRILRKTNCYVWIRYYDDKTVSRVINYNVQLQKKYENQVSEYSHISDEA